MPRASATCRRCRTTSVRGPASCARSSLRHGNPLDAERGELLVRAGEDAATRDLVAALLVPLAGRLATPEGRDYLRIVAQMTEEFPGWRIETELTPPQLRRILGLLEVGPPSVAPEVRRERVVLVIMLMTSAMAERARAVDAPGPPPELDQATFVANLTDVIVAALEAPPGAASGVEPEAGQALTGVG